MSKVLRTIGRKKLINSIDEFFSYNTTIGNYCGFNTSIARRTISDLKVFLKRRLK